TVESGTIHSIIGPNGAGKSSLLNCVSGLYKATAGQIMLHRQGKQGRNAESRGSADLQAKDLSRLPPHRVARLGVVRSFQNIELFDMLSVLDNIMLGRYMHIKKDTFIAMLWFGPAKRQESRQRERVEEVIHLLKLQEYRNHPVGWLAYGIQK